ncbi:MAG: ThuA domain-containing protein [Planctomycetaceae bacterium]|nr:ThuA domain-containing protein [Planctomycetaceae bacterium]
MFHTRSILSHTLLVSIAFCAVQSRLRGDERAWIVYEGTSGLGFGKNIVLISGDEEYRSEEALPQLGKILADRHGFRCTVLFAIDPQTGLINPNCGTNIPGLEALDTTDLMVIFTRFRDLPDDQMQHIDRFLRAGKPVIGMRTASHAFNIAGEKPWAQYGNYYNGEKAEWADGFGRLVLGEKWISHHGHHKHESTRGLIADGAKNHPVLRGINDGGIWGPTDVYGVRLPLPGDSLPLVLGQVVMRDGEYDEKDPFYGMKPDDSRPVPGEKNAPMMPIAWTKTYQLPGGQIGHSFTTTMGASTDLVNESVRRLLVNAVYWLLDMDEQIPQTGTDVRIVGDYKPTGFEFRPDEYWTKRKMQVSELEEAFQGAE